MEDKFEKWNYLPEELKLECVETMGTETRFNLHDSSLSDRELVEKAAKGELHNVRIKRDQEKDTIEITCEKLGSFPDLLSRDPKVLSSKFEPLMLDHSVKAMTRERWMTHGVRFLSFVLQHYNVTTIWVENTDEAMIEFLGALDGTKKFSVLFLHGQVPECLLRNCVSVHSLNIDWPDSWNELDAILDLPMAKSVRKWSCSSKSGDNCPVKIIKKCLEYNFKTMSHFMFEIPRKISFDDVLEKLEDVKIVCRKKYTIVLQMPNPEKYIHVGMSATSPSHTRFRMEVKWASQFQERYCF